MGHQAAYRAKREPPVTADGLPPSIAPARQAIELTEGECWRLLASVSIGRVVFTQRAMPAIRPVNHVIDGRTIFIRTHLGAAIAARASDARGEPRGSVVCYEADDLDPARRAGWSVIVTGMARLVTDPAAASRYAAAVEPWITGDLNQVVSIEPQFVSGIRLMGRPA
jgi:nitroimidazol reductase NimA-like FMN-containing flavoprotein (pyridoxamine 5'-phosphate oxidase superfamily)